jgi:Haem-binding domain
MKKLLKITVIILACGFALIQFIRPARTNPIVNQAETLEASTDVPQNVSEMLSRSCSDCHSNNTNWIWYSNIAPISWKIVEHVNEGRQKLNFSIWFTYAADRKKRKFDEICSEVEIGEMPHSQYLWLHWDAKLSENDIESLCEWTKKEAAKISE